jgi:transposase InsO family protein
VIERILDIRDHPPKGLGRTPGPRAILYYLHQDEALKVILEAQGYDMPRSTRTIWKVLTRHQRIHHLPKVEHEVMERSAPDEEWGIDFKDVSSATPQAEGKQAHVIEILNVVDHGSSALVDTQVDDDFNAESALLAVADILRTHGCPKRIRMDRDPRWVGSSSGKDFPSALLRFLIAVGIEPIVCPPQRPDKNPFVERYHRNLKYECLLLSCPQDLSTTRDVNCAYAQHYNFERPNQPITCQNQPPRVTFPYSLTLPRLPEVVDPDSWVSRFHGQCYKRRVDCNGRIQIGKQRYYVNKALAGRYVIIRINGQERFFVVERNRQAIKQLPIKGLCNQKMLFQDYLEMMCQEALSEWRNWRSRHTFRHG